MVITITWLHMMISKLWIINGRFNKGICSSYPLKDTNLKINLTQVSCRKHITRKISEKYPMFVLKRGISFVVFHNIPRRGIFLSIPDLNSEKYGINSFSLRGSFVEEPTNKVKKCNFIQEYELLLKQSENLLCTCSACKA